MTVLLVDDADEDIGVVPGERVIGYLLNPMEEVSLSLLSALVTPFPSRSGEIELAEALRSLQLLLKVESILCLMDVSFPEGRNVLSEYHLNMSLFDVSF